MNNDQNQNSSDGSDDSGVIIHTLQDDLNSLGVVSAEGDIGASKDAQEKKSEAVPDGNNRQREENFRNTSPFLSSAPPSGNFQRSVSSQVGLGKKAKVEVPEKKEEKKVAAQKTGFFGLGRFFKKTKEKQTVPKKLPVKVVEPDKKESPWDNKNRGEEPRKPLFTDAQPIQKDIFQKDKPKMPLFGSKTPPKEVFHGSRPVMMKAVEKAVAEEKPKENVTEKKESSRSGIFGIFKNGDSEKTAEEIEELKNDRQVLEQKNKELEQARSVLEVKIKQYTSELKVIKENEAKLVRHTEELKKNATSLDQQVIEKNQILKERIKQLEESGARAKEREVKMLSLKNKIEELEKEILDREIKIKKAESQTGFFGMIRKRRNRKLIETGENLRKIHYALENKNKELKRSKELLEEGVRKHMRELKALKDNEEKAIRHLEDLKKNETDLNQHATEKENELKEKFELLKASLERQVAEKSTVLKEKMEKAGEMNAKVNESDKRLSELKEKIEEIEKEIAAKKASAGEIMQKAEKEIAAKEAMAKVKLEGIEKEIAAKEAATKTKSEDPGRKTADKNINLKEATKKSGIFGLFSKKSEKKEEKAIKIEAPADLPIKLASPFENSKKAEIQPNFNRAAQVLEGQIKKEERGKIEMLGQKPIQAKKLRWGRVFATSLVLVIIVAVCAGGYIFLTTRNNNISIQSASEPIVEPPVVEVTQTVFSTDKPNYLNIDVESTSTLKITQLLVSTSLDIQKENIVAPVEFLTTDANNNPLAFSVFANLAGLNISADVLSSFEEGFSLYIYNDNGNARVALAVDLKNKEMAVSELLKEESQLNNGLAPIFLGEPVEQGTITFKDGQYNGLAIRYVNLNSQNTISLDYAFLDGQLVVGTSKDTLRAVLDKIGVVETETGE